MLNKTFLLSRNYFHLLLFFILLGMYMPTFAEETESSQAESLREAKTAPHLQKATFWKNLKPRELFTSYAGLKFYELQTDNGSAAYLAVLDLNDHALKLSPFFNKKPGATSDAVRRFGALVATNGGYFNLSDGESTSYVTIGGKPQCEPHNNKALVNNPELQPYLDQIFDRTELRLLINKQGQQLAAISHHNSPLPADYQLESSIQGGPRLLPHLTAQSEAFVRKSPEGNLVDAIGSVKLAARTAVGITSDNHVLLLCVASKGQDEFSSGITLQDLSQLLKTLGCNEAMNLDGGTSTTMVICDICTAVEYRILQVCGKTPEKLVKSGLMVVIEK